MIKDKSILIHNIYYMLAYAFEALHEDICKDTAVEKFENIHNLFAAILVNGIGRQIKRGLHREYISHTGDMSVVMGKINMPGTVKNRIAQKRLVACEYDEFSENNRFNQILKTTAELLLHHSAVEDEYKNKLKKAMLYFSNVDTLNPSAIHWSSLSFGRGSGTYRMLLGVCRLVIKGLLLTTARGDYQLNSFVNDSEMSRLYEKFILEYYKKELAHRHIKVSASQIPWAIDDGFTDRLPQMRSDIMLERGSTVLIIDAKYYTHTMQSRYNARTLHSNNLYQIFAYVKNKDAAFAGKPHTVSGMLLYARTDEENQPDGTYQMSGNKISVKTLDLNRPFAQIRAQLDKIAEENIAMLRGVAANTTLGNVNSDSGIDINDATDIQKSIAQITSLTSAQKKAADVNGDGSVDITDAALVQKYAARIITAFPAEK